MSNKLQKFISIFIGLTTLVWSSGIALIAPLAVSTAAAATLYDGELIKTPTSPDVYIVKLVGNHQYKRLILNPEVFNSYGHLSWNKIQTVDQATVDSLTTSDLVRCYDPENGVNDPKVYKLSPSGDTGIKQWLNMTPAQFEAAGYHWDQIYTINVFERDIYTTGADITANESSSSNSNTSVTPQANNGLTVGLADNNPAAVVLASGTAFNPVLRVKLSTAGNDVNVTSMTFKKSGLVGNTKITGIDLVDSKGIRHGNVISSINADNTITISMSADPIVVKANSPETVTLRIDLASDASSGTVQFSVQSADDISANEPINGTFPIIGNSMSISDGSSAIATVTMDEQPINSSGANLNVDTENEQDIAKFSIAEESSNEDIKIEKLTIYNNGNAADTDYKDVQLVTSDGTVLATAQPSGQYVTFDLSSSPYVISEGLTRYLTVRAKIVSGASRTIQFVVYNDYDLVVKGASSGAYILPSAGSNDSSFPIGNNPTDYNKVTISSGSLSFNKDANSPSTSVAPGNSDVVLAKFYAKPTGENMELRKVSLAVVKDGSTNLSGNVFVKVNGSTVWSGAASDVSTDASNPTSITLNTYPTLTTGQNNYITIVGNINTNATSGDAYTAYLNLTEVKRLITNDIINPGVSQAHGNTIQVKAAALTVTTLGLPVAQSTVAGTNDFELARFDLDASNSGEDVKVTQLIVTDTIAGGAAYTDINNLRMYDLADPSNALVTTSNTNTNAATVTFTFANPIVVPAGGVKHLSLKGDIVSGTTGSHTFNIAASSDVTAVGASTGNTITSPDVSGTGQAMTLVASGSMTLSLVSGTGASPSADQLLGIGTQNETVFAFKMTALYEAQKVTTITLTATGTALTTNDLANLRLYRNSETTPFASASQMTCSNNVCTKTWTAADNILSDPINPGSPVTIYVKADIGAENAAKLGDDFHFMIASTTDVITKGVSSGSAGTVTGTPAVSAISYISPFNVEVAADTPTTGTSNTQTVTSGTTIGRFKVTNNGSAPITLTNVSFTDNGSNSTTSEVYSLYASSENSADYTANLMATSTNSVNFGAIAPANQITINGGAYRYLTVIISNATGLASGDSFNLAVSSLGDLKYSVNEASLGYDANADGDISDTITGLYTDGKPVLGTIVKQ